MSKRDVFQELKSAKDERLTVRVPERVLRRVAQLAKEQGATQSEIALRLLEAGLRVLDDPRNLFDDDE